MKCDSKSRANPAHDGATGRLLLPGAATVLAAAGLWSIAGAVSCDSTAKFALPDRQFYMIEAVTAFPAKIAANGHVVGRVCGAPLDPSDKSLPAEPGPEEANGLEVTANFVSSSFDKAACPNDQDLSIKEGEIINLTRVKTAAPAVSVATGNFRLKTNCITKPSDPTVCDKSSGETIDASEVKYRNINGRCDPAQVEATRINVALVLDNSGSIKGSVDKQVFKEDTENQFDSPPTPQTALASDWDGARLTAAENFVESLNPNDRVVGYFFDETGPKVASSNSYICTGGGNDGGRCHPTAPDSCPGGFCDSDAGLANDDYAISLPDSQCLAFGANPALRVDLKNGIELKRNAASGRASVWKSVDNAFKFLTGGGSECVNNGNTFGTLRAMHIIVVADGPDTCADGDDFSYTTLKDANVVKDICRTRCSTYTDTSWKKTLLTMAKFIGPDGAPQPYPVHVHFVQFQSQGYLEPDPRMIEMACRTDGTYQFINSEAFNKSAPDAFHQALSTAVARVRNGLSGTWRVAYPWASITQEQAFPKGTIRAVDGDFLFEDKKFTSLDSAVHDDKRQSWRFTLSGAEDRRVLVRIPCATDLDCKGTDPCAPNHCGEGGVCRPEAAPNGRPCSADGKSRCMNGVCKANTSCNDAIKP